MANLTKDGRQKTIRHYYECPTHKLKSCCTKSVNADYLENYVLDAVVNIINSFDISQELIFKKNEQISFYNGIIRKNQIILKEKNQIFDSMFNKISTLTNKILIQRLEKRLEELAEEIGSYEEKIQTQKLIVKNLKTQDLTAKLEKSELLSDRTIAQSIIREVIKSVEIDETTGAIIIITY